MEYFIPLALALSFTFTSSTPIFNLTTDEHALLSFQNSLTSDPHALLSHNWSSNFSICSWTGVSCGAKHRRVTALNFSGFHLAGTISPHLSNLTLLQSLDISSNSFTGSLPRELSNLRRLKELNAGFNSLTAQIPPWLGRLSRLQHLYLNNNTFSGPIPLPLFNISRLQTLDLGYNFLDGNIPEEIANFSGLEILNLAGNKIVGSIPNGVLKMSSLIEINLTSNRLSGELPNDVCGNANPKLKRIYLSDNHLYGEIPANIYKCRELEELRLPANNLSGGIPREIGRLPMLRILYLWTNHFKGDIPREIGNLTSLQQLDLCDNNMTGVLPQEVGNLHHLEYLNVRHNSLSGSIPSSIFNLSSLKFLDLSINHFSGTIPTDNGKSFTHHNLEVLHLLENRLTGEIPSFITSNSSKLTSLSLQNNSFIGPMPDFGNLRLLRKLYISGNQLTGAESPVLELGLFHSLTNCRYLENLEISYNPLNGILPASIGNLSTSLQYFAASACNIHGVIPLEIGNLTSLIDLRLNTNKMAGSVPRRLWNLRKLQGLNLSDNYFQGGISVDVCLMSNLETLGLGGNNLTGPIPDCLGEVKSLRHIYLASNELGSAVPSGLWDLRDLLTLNLSSNYLGGQLPSQIGNLKQMYQLDLSCNLFSGDIPDAVDSCQSLELLSLSNNKLQGSIPRSLGSVRGLTALDLSRNNLSGLIPKSLEDLHFLQYFDVSYNSLEGEIPGRIANSTAQSFAHNSALCGEAEFQVPCCVNEHGRRRSKNVALMFVKYAVPPLVAAAIVVVVVLMLVRAPKRRVIRPAVDISVPYNLVWRRISYIELARGTFSFSETNLLGIGTFGSVYKAILSDGLNIAVKVFNLELEGATKSFDTESEILSSIRHRNLLPVIGCCTNPEFRALILKYMPNGSLEKWLHSDSYFLDVVQRLNIALDVALALEYLHHGHPFPVVHCDIKPSNVLLDEDMTARVGDFGISKLFEEGEALTHTTTLATVGYAAPEYGSEGKVSASGDVYSYGILVLEMFTQKKPTDDMFSEEMSLKDWVNRALRGNAVREIMAPGLASREDEQDLCGNEECVSSVLEVGMKCLAFSPHRRIGMKQVVAHLHKIKAELQQQMRSTASTEGGE